MSGAAYPRKRRYPKEVVVKGAVWEVRFARVLDPEDSLTQGLCDPTERILWIRLGQTPKDTLKTFIHELIHAMEDEYKSDLGHKNVYVLEEMLTRFYSENFTKLF